MLKYSREADFIAPQTISVKTVKYKNEVFESVPVIGTNEQFKDTDNINPATGRFLTELDVYRTIMYVFWAMMLRKKLFKDESPLGKRMKIGSDKFTGNRC